MTKRTPDSAAHSARGLPLRQPPQEADEMHHCSCSSCSSAALGAAHAQPPRQLSTVVTAADDSDDDSQQASQQSCHCRHSASSQKHSAQEQRRHQRQQPCQYQNTASPPSKKADDHKCPESGIPEKREQYPGCFIDFMNKASTVFHAYEFFSEMLQNNDFQELNMDNDWNGMLEKNNNYFVGRDQRSIIAFSIGKNFETSDHGIALTAAHLDSPAIRLKANSRMDPVEDMIRVRVAPYDGGLNQTWWDRDLGVGGRVIYKEGDGAATKNVRLDHPIAKIPTLAPHFGLGMYGAGNLETNAVPIIGLTTTKSDDKDPIPEGSFASRQPPQLVHAICKAAGVKPADLRYWDLDLYEFQPATLCGINKDFISAGRIDDKICSWTSIVSLIQSSKKKEDSSFIKIAALFDFEEIGSRQRAGAMSNFLPLVIERLVDCLKPEDNNVVTELSGVLERSFMISADVTHAYNPNFPEAYVTNARPRLNVGVTVSADGSARMTTDAWSATVLQGVADRVEPAANSNADEAEPERKPELQVFQIRNDTRSDATIGPILGALQGIRGADAGVAQLARHSVRATVGADDPYQCVRFFTGFFNEWEKMQQDYQL